MGQFQSIDLLARRRDFWNIARKYLHPCEMKLLLFALCNKPWQECMDEFARDEQWTHARRYPYVIPIVNYAATIPGLALYKALDDRYEFVAARANIRIDGCVQREIPVGTSRDERYDYMKFDVDAPAWVLSKIASCEPMHRIVKIVRKMGTPPTNLLQCLSNFGRGEEFTMLTRIPCPPVTQAKRSAVANCIEANIKIFIEKVDGKPGVLSPQIYKSLRDLILKNRLPPKVFAVIVQHVPQSDLFTLMLDIARVQNYDYMRALWPRYSSYLAQNCDLDAVYEQRKRLVSEALHPRLIAIINNRVYPSAQVIATIAYKKVKKIASEHPLITGIIVGIGISAIITKITSK